MSKTKQNITSLANKVSPQRGFTLVEVMITLTLFTLMSIGVFGSITVLHQISRRQAVYSSVLALVMQQQEAIRAAGYTAPNARYPAGNTPITEFHTTREKFRRIYRHKAIV